MGQPARSGETGHILQDYRQVLQDEHLATVKHIKSVENFETVLEHLETVVEHLEISTSRLLSTLRQTYQNCQNCQNEYKALIPDDRHLRAMQILQSQSLYSDLYLGGQRPDRQHLSRAWLQLS